MTTKETEAQQLAALFEKARVTNYAEFAREHDIPGGKSMLSQHLNAGRPISLDCAVAYAIAFEVPLADISKRLATVVERLPQSFTLAEPAPAPYGKKVSPLPKKLAAHVAELHKIIDSLNRDGQMILLGRAQELTTKYAAAKANPAS